MTGLRESLDWDGLKTVTPVRAASPGKRVAELSGGVIRLAGAVPTGERVRRTRAPPSCPPRKRGG
jgi:hypothetical protein